MRVRPRHNWHSAQKRTCAHRLRGVCPWSATSFSAIVSGRCFPLLAARMPSWKNLAPSAFPSAAGMRRYQAHPLPCSPTQRIGPVRVLATCEMACRIGPSIGDDDRGGQGGRERCCGAERAARARAWHSSSQVKFYQIGFCVSSDIERTSACCCARTRNCARNQRMSVGVSQRQHRTTSASWTSQSRAGSSCSVHPALIFDPLSL